MRRKIWLFLSLIIFGFCGTIGTLSLSSVAEASSTTALVWTGGVSGNTYVDSDGSTLTISTSDFYQNGTVWYIYSAKGLAYFANQVNSGTSYSGNTIQLMTDIDWDGESWIPIGTSSQTFAGTFNGNGHYVYNININTANGNYAGFFGYIGSSAGVVDLHLRNLSVTASATYIGGLVGAFTTSGSVNIENCSVKGEINISTSSASTQYVGGLIGQGISSARYVYVVQNSMTDVEISISASGSTKYIGGIAGSFSGYMVTSYSTGSITSTSNAVSYVGGLVGASSSILSIGNSYSTSVINFSGTGSSAGGLVGSVYNCNSVTVTNSYYYGEISSSSSGVYIGGLVGDGRVSSSSSIQNSFVIATLTATNTTSNAGAVCGTSSNLQINSNVYYEVSIAGSSTSNECNLDGLSALARTQGFYVNSNYWSTIWSSSYWSVSASINDALAYLDVSGNADNDSELSSESALKGEGTAQSPYLIETAGDLIYVSLMYAESNSSLENKILYFSLQNDIDLSGKTWTPIGFETSFTGVFDGNNHTISGLTCSLQLNYSYYGLFAKTRNAVIKNLILSDARYVGSETDANTNIYYGTLVAAAGDGTYIINCRDDSSVDGVKSVNIVSSSSYNPVYIVYGKNNLNSTGSTILSSSITMNGTYSTGYDVAIDSDGGIVYKTGVTDLTITTDNIYLGEYHLLLTSSGGLLSQSIDSTFGKTVFPKSYIVAYRSGMSEEGSLYDFMTKEGYSLDGYTYSYNGTTVDESSLNLVWAINGLVASWEELTITITVVYNQYEIKNFNAEGSSSSYIDSSVYDASGNVISGSTFQLSGDQVYVNYYLRYGARLSAYSYIFDTPYYRTTSGTYVALRGSNYVVSGIYSDSDFKNSWGSDLTSVVCETLEGVDDLNLTATVYARWEGTNNSEGNSVTIKFETNDEVDVDVANIVKSISMSYVSSDTVTGSGTWVSANLNNGSITIDYTAIRSASINDAVRFVISLDDGYVISGHSMSLTGSRDLNFGDYSEIYYDGDNTFDYKNLVGQYTLTITIEKGEYTDKISISKNVYFGLSPYQLFNVTELNGVYSSNVQVLVTGGYTDILYALGWIDTDGYATATAEALTYEYNSASVNVLSLLAATGECYLTYDYYKETFIFSVSNYYVSASYSQTTYSSIYLLYDEGEESQHYYRIQKVSNEDGETVTLYDLGSDNSSGTALVQVTLAEAESGFLEGEFTFKARNSFVMLFSTEMDELQFSFKYDNAPSNAHFESAMDSTNSKFFKVLEIFDDVTKSSSVNGELTIVTVYTAAMVDFNIVDENGYPIDTNSPKALFSDGTSLKTYTTGASGQISFYVESTEYYKFKLVNNGVVLGENVSITVEGVLDDNGDEDTAYYSSFESVISNYINSCTLDGLTNPGTESDYLRYNITLGFTNQLKNGHYTITIVCEEIEYSVDYGTWFYDYSDIQSYISSSGTISDSSGLADYINDNKSPNTESSDDVTTSVWQVGNVGGTTSLNYDDQIYMTTSSTDSGYVFLGWFVYSADNSNQYSFFSDNDFEKVYGDLYGKATYNGEGSYQLTYGLYAYAVYVKKSATFTTLNNSWVDVDNVNGQTDVTLYTTAGGLELSISMEAGYYEYSSSQVAIEDLTMTITGSYVEGYYAVGYRIYSNSGHSAENMMQERYFSDKVFSSDGTMTLTISGWADFLIDALTNGDIMSDVVSGTFFIVPILEQKAVTLQFHSGTGQSNEFTDGLAGNVYDDNNQETTDLSYEYSVKIYFNSDISLSIDSIVPDGESSQISSLYSYRTGYYKRLFGYWMWQTNNGSGTLTDDVFESSNVEYFTTQSVESVVHLYITWTASTTLLTLDHNGATTYDANYVTATYGLSALSSDVENPIRTGYIFAGWTLSQDGNDFIIDANGVLVADVSGYTNSSGEWIYDQSKIYSAIDPYSTITIYASWTADSYQIALNANGGLIDSSDLATYSIYYDSDFSTLNDGEGLPTPIRDGFEFAGWYIIYGNTMYEVTNDTVFSQSLLSIDFNTTPVLTLYARWTALSDYYSLTLDKTTIDGLTYSGTDQTIYLTDFFEDDSGKYYTSSGFDISVSDQTLTINALNSDMQVDFNVTTTSSSEISQDYQSFTVKNAGNYSYTFTLTVTDTASYMNNGTVFTVTITIFVVVSKADLNFSYNDIDDDTLENFYLSNIRRIMEPFLDETTNTALSQVSSLSGLYTFAVNTLNETISSNLSGTALYEEVYNYLMVKYYLLMHTNDGTESYTYKNWTYQDYLTFVSENEEEVQEIEENIKMFVYYDHATSVYTINLNEYYSISAVNGVGSDLISVSTVLLTTSSSTVSVTARASYEVRLYFSNSEVLSNYNILSDGSLNYIVLGDVYAYVMPEVLSVDNLETSSYYSSEYANTTREVTWQGASAYVEISGRTYYNVVDNLYVYAELYTSNGGQYNANTEFSFTDFVNYLFFSDVRVMYQYTYQEEDAYVDISTRFKLVTSSTYTIMKIDDIVSVTLLMQYLTITNSVQTIQDMSSLDIDVDLIEVQGVYYDIGDGEVYQTISQNGEDVTVGDIILLEYVTQGDGQLSLYVNKFVTRIVFNMPKTVGEYIGLYKWLDGEYDEEGVDGTMESSSNMTLILDWDGSGGVESSDSISHYITATVTTEENVLSTVELTALYTDLVRVNFSYNFPASYTASVIDHTFIKLGETTLDTFEYPTDENFGTAVLTVNGVAFENLFSSGGVYEGYYDDIFTQIYADARWNLTAQISATQLTYTYMAAVSTVTYLNVSTIALMHNTNTTIYDYSYEWLKLDGSSYVSMSSGETLVFSNGGGTDDSGSYRLVVTVSVKSEFLNCLDSASVTTASRTFDFTVEFFRLNAVQLSSEVDSVTYSNVNYLYYWTVNLSYQIWDNESQSYGSDIETVSIGYGEISFINFEVLYQDQVVTSMTDAGVYTIRFTLDENIFDFDNLQLSGISYAEGYYYFTFTILPREVELSNYNLNSSKVFNGYEDSIDATIYVSDTYENVEIYLNREEGEDVGEYKIYLSPQQNGNYIFLMNSVVLFDGTSLTEDADDTQVGTFTITASSILRLSFEGPVIYKNYSTSGYSVTLTEDFKLRITSGSQTWEYTLTLYDYSKGETITDGKILDIIKQYFTEITAYFYQTEKISTAINSGTYTFEFDANSFASYYTTVEMLQTYQFVIEQIEIDISNMTFSKVYDATNTDTVDVEGYEGLQILVTYASIHVGEWDVSLRLYSQSDSLINSGNFKLSTSVAKGTIEKANATLSFELSQSVAEEDGTYVYGTISTNNYQNYITNITVKDGVGNDITSRLLSGYYSMSYSLSSISANANGYLYVGTYTISVVDSWFNDFNMTISSVQFEVSPLQIDAQVPENYITILTGNPVEEYYTLDQTVASTGDQLVIYLQVVNNSGIVSAGTVLGSGVYNFVLDETQTKENNVCVSNGSVIITVSSDNAGLYVVDGTNILYIQLDEDALSLIYDSKSHTISTTTGTNPTLMIDGKEVELTFLDENGAEATGFTLTEFSVYYSTNITTFTDAGTYFLSLSASGTASGGGAFTTILFSDTYYLTIERATIETSRLVFSKTYDAISTMTVTTYSDSTLIALGSDDVGVYGRFNDASVGTNKTVTLSLVGSNASNYQLDNDEVLGSILQATATITLSKTEFTYGELFYLEQVLSGISSYISVKSGDDEILSSAYSLEIKISTQSGSSDIASSIGYLNAGSYTITITNTATNSNYYIEEFSEIISISRYEFSLTFTIDGEISVEYGTELNGAEVPYTVMSPLSENISLTLIRDSASKDIGYYHIIDDSYSTQNYVVTVTDTSTSGAFAITGVQSQILYAFFAGCEEDDIPTIVYEYDGNEYTEVSLEYNESYGWMIVFRTADSSSAIGYVLSFYTLVDGEYVYYSNGSEITDLTSTLSFVSTGKDVGTYYIRATNTYSSTHEVRLGKADTLFAYLFEISVKNVYFTTSTIVQQFNNQQAIYQYTDLSQILTGILDSDVYLEVKFWDGQELAFNTGIGYAVTAELYGTGTGNYNLILSTATGGTLSGQITRASITVVIDTQYFTYGAFYFSTITWSYVADFDVEEYISQNPSDALQLLFSNASYSGTGNLNAGEYQLYFEYSSNNFVIEQYIVDGNPQTTCAKLIILQKELTITATNEDLQTIFTKRYDGTTEVDIFDSESNLRFAISGLLSGDDAKLASATYSSEATGTNNAITFNLTGTDAGNYTISSYFYGEITAVKIVINYDYNTSEEVSSGVSDEILQAIAYPFTSVSSLSANAYSSSASSFPSSPELEGYKFLYWTINFEDLFGSLTDRQKAFLDNLISRLSLTTVEEGAYNIVVGNNEQTVSLLMALLEDEDNLFGLYFAKDDNFALDSDEQLSLSVTFTANWEVNTHSLTVTMQDSNGDDNDSLGEIEIYIVGDDSEESVDLEENNIFVYGTKFKIVASANSHYSYYGFYDGETSITDVAYDGNTYTITFTLTKDTEIFVRFAVQQVNIYIDLSNATDAIINNTNFVWVSDNLYLWSVDYFTLQSYTLTALDIERYGYNFVGVMNGSQTISFEDFAENFLTSFIAESEINESYVNITFTPVFEAKDVVVYLDANGGTLTDSSVTIPFGANYLDYLPTPEWLGYEFLYWTLNDEIITDESVVSTEDAHTLVARWQIQEFTLTLISPNTTVESNLFTYDSQTSTYTAQIEYGDTISFDVSAKTGYSLITDIDAWGENFSIVYNNSGGITVSLTMPAQDVEITIPVQARENALTINSANIESVLVYKVTSDGDEEISINSGRYIVETGTTIKIVITAETGYIVSDAYQYFGSADLNISEVWSDDDKVLTLTISGINQDTSFNFEGSPNGNQITLNFSDFSIVTLVVDGRTQTTTTFVVLTDYEFEFYVQYAYGYEFESYDAYETFTVTCEYVNEGTWAGYYHFVISDIKSDGIVDINSKAMTFTITVEVITYDEGGATIQTEGNTAYINTQGVTSLEVSYGEYVELYANSNYDTFAIWSKNGTDELSSENPFSYQVTQTETIYAIFSSNGEFSIELSAYIYSQVYDESGALVDRFVLLETEFYQNNQQVTSIELYYGVSRTISFELPEGYVYYGYGYENDGVFEFIVERDIKTDTLVEVTISSSDIEKYAVTKIYLVVWSQEVSVQVSTMIDIDGTYLETDSVGELSLVGSDGESVNSSGYVIGSGVHYSSYTSAQNFEVIAYTNEIIYIKVTAEIDGYTFSKIISNLENVIQIDLVQTGNNFFIYSVSGLIGGMSGIELTVFYTPNINSIDIVFENGSGVVNGGKFEVTYSTELRQVWTSGDGYSSVTVLAYTDSTFVVTAYIAVGFNGENLRIIGENGEDLTDVVVFDLTYEALSVTDTGYSGKVTFTVRDYVGCGYIRLILTPETYTVELKDGSDVLVRITNVEYMSTLDITESNRDNIQIVDSRITFVNGKLNLVLSDSTHNFQGYFTYQNGAGVQYIDSSGEVTSNWMENGYTLNSITRKYELTTNAKEQNGTLIISLYLYQSYLKTRITFEFVPSEITTITAQDMISGVDYTNSWFYSSSPYYIEVAYNTDIYITAPELEGYKFYKFVISQKVSDGTWLSDVTSYSERLYWSTNEYDNVVECYVQVVYFAEVDVRVMTGNATYVITQQVDDSSQARALLEQGYVDTTTSFQIEAVAGDGYTFSRWVNTTTLQTVTNSSLTLSTTKKLTLLLYLEGLPVTLNFSDYDTTHGQIVALQTTSVDGSISYYTLGQTVDDSFVKTRENVTVAVGDVVTLILTVDYGFAVTWDESLGIVLENYANGQYYFTFTIDTKYANQTINIIPTFDNEVLQIYFFTSIEPELDTAVDNNNGSIAGYVTSNGSRVTQIAVARGEAISLNMVVNSRYEIVSVKLLNYGRTFDVEFEDGQILLSETFLNDNDIVGTMSIYITFARLMWEDHVVEEYFQGSGTASDPYRIYDIDDLILMMQLCNSGETSSNGLKYRDCAYIVMADINLSEEFWTPIGTEENPFGGSFNFNNHTISGIYLAIFYSQIAYSGLFGVLASYANITEGEPSWWWIILIIAIILLLIIILVVTIYESKKRKKKREELAKR